MPPPAACSRSLGTAVSGGSPLFPRHPSRQVAPTSAPAPRCPTFPQPPPGLPEPRGLLPAPPGRDGAPRAAERAAGRHGRWGLGGPSRPRADEVAGETLSTGLSRRPRRGRVCRRSDGEDGTRHPYVWGAEGRRVRSFKKERSQPFKKENYRALGGGRETSDAGVFLVSPPESQPGGDCSRLAAPPGRAGARSLSPSRALPGAGCRGKGAGA